jgi:hypothetical protein
VHDLTEDRDHVRHRARSTERKRGLCHILLGSPHANARCFAREAFVNIRHIATPLLSVCVVIACGGSANDNPNAAASNVASSQATPPWGIWAMEVQYGPPGQAVNPIAPYQVELRPDGTAYRWLCAGAPDDGSVLTVCGTPSRTQCLSGGTIAWDGMRWHLSFPNNALGLVSGAGDISPDGNGNIVISYIDPTYSGGLFRRIGAPSSGVSGC